MPENKKSLLLLRTHIDKLDTQLWVTIGEKIAIWNDMHKEKEILYRKELSLFLKENKSLFEGVDQDFFLKFLDRIEVFCKKEGVSNSVKSTDYILLLSTDRLILKILKKRFEVAYKIGLLKKKQKITITDSVRYQQILDLTKKKVKILKISEEMAVSLMELIHDYSVKIQEKL